MRGRRGRDGVRLGRPRAARKGRGGAPEGGVQARGVPAGPPRPRGRAAGLMGPARLPASPQILYHEGLRSTRRSVP